MRKAEIARRIAEATGLTQVKIDDVVNAILDEIKVALQRGDAVTLRRFGSFGVRDKGSRQGRNPKTGQSAAIAARRVVYLGYADKYLRPLASRLSDVNQPVICTQNRFSTPRLRLFACIWAH
jgi:integration host factor subunit alpha